MLDSINVSVERDVTARFERTTAVSVPTIEFISGVPMWEVVGA